MSKSQKVGLRLDGVISVHLPDATGNYVRHQMNDQMVDIYGVPCDVQPVRTFRDGRQLGVGYDLRAPATWFVYDQAAGSSGNGIWHMHCGPYSTFEQAKQWIKDIRETPHE